MHDYKKLTVWNESVDLAVEIYRIVSGFPKEEMYAIASQIKRSAVSIPSNIAEGAGRFTDKMFQNFLSNAHASSCELDTQIIIARRLDFMEQDKFEYVGDKINHIQRMIINLDRSLAKP